MVSNRALSALAFLFGIGSLSFIWFGGPDDVSRLTQEDGVVENLSALFYMIALIVCFISIFKVEKLVLPIIWLFLCFIFLGEETSWFTRLFQYSAPLVEQLNAQGEFNLHNMDVLQGGNLSDSSFELGSLLKSQNLFRIGFFGYFLIIPFFLYVPLLEKVMSNIGYQKPDIAFFLVLFLVFFLSFFAVLFSPEEVKSALAETREMLYAFFIMLYAIAYIWPKKTPT
ncbi:MAG: hypothetical protein KUG72_05255 [Pseudomonadales bacterium]|nr:hypothetical protein [Pseudomonadales bacterium]